MRHNIVARLDIKVIIATHTRLINFIERYMEEKIQDTFVS